MLKRALFALSVGAIATGALAQAQPKKCAKGGIMAKSHGHPIEFVNKGQEIVFYISDDDGSPLPTKQMTGRATVQDGGKTTIIPLAPTEPNLMVAKLQAPLGSKARVAFSASLHGHSLTARYVTE
jgi:hypothetical protein